MKVTVKSACLLLFFLIAGCAATPLQVVSAGTGSGLEVEGTISDSGLIFTFPEYTGEGTVQKLFNYIYFKGDTLCFSFSLNRDVPGDSVRVLFTDARTGRSFPAERIDVRDNNICGFSLVGTILEQFYSKDLKQAVPEKAYCCRDIPFKVSLQVKAEKERLEHTQTGSFRIIYESKRI